MNFIKIASVVLIVLLGISTTALGATWQVEQDGSADFTVIQEAVDAAAHGDTILIGPGRFDTFRPFSAPAWTEDVIVGITKDNLVFVGSGPGVTIIGPESYFGPYWADPKCFCSIDGYNATIRDITIENVETGIYWYLGRLEVVNCNFRGEGSTYCGIAAWCDGGMLVDNCDFDLGNLSHGITTWWPGVNSVVTNCRFWGPASGFGCGGSSGVILESCTFDSMWSGVTLDSGSSGIIRNCQFSQGFERYAIAATFSSSIQLNGCHVDGATEGVLVTMGSSLTGSGNVIANTTEVGLWIRSQSTVSLENSHLLPAIGPAVKCSYFLNPPDIFQNLSNNYWGTTDPAQIEGMIEDGNDDSGEHSFVNFSPYAGQLVSTENMTMDGLKALYR